MSTSSAIEGRVQNSLVEKSTQSLEAGIGGASTNDDTEEESAVKVAEEGGDADMISPLLTSVGVNLKLSESPLMGTVFTRNNDDVGEISIHFDKKVGCYVSYEYDGYSSIKLDDGTAISKRMFFTEQTFDPDERKFTGVTDYGGIWEGDISERYEMTFDTQFLSVLSGKRFYIKENGEKKTVDTYGEDCFYTNTRLETMNEDTEKRLRGEGASEKSIEPVLKEFRKQKLKQKLVKTQAELAKKMRQTTLFLENSREAYLSRTIRRLE